LRMSPRKPRHVANIEARIRALFHDRDKLFHTIAVRISLETRDVERPSSVDRLWQGPSAKAAEVRFGVSGVTLVDLVSE
jgi:hypothetical protein